MERRCIMSFDCIKQIGVEIAKAEQERDNIPEDIGMMKIRKLNQVLLEASLRPNPQPLWLTLWYEGEVCCLFADSGVGKSIYAVQIATHIATSQKVLLFDFELSDKQAQLRYTDNNGNLYQFPDNLFRGELNPSKIDASDIEESIMRNIEEIAVTIGAKVIIIDNLTYLCNTSEKGDVAGVLMMKLMELKRKHSLSILVVAHTPKRNMSNPITQNDLAGSKKLFNFFDSVFSIGKSGKDSNLRYIKQIKVRNGGFDYDGNNVIVCSIEKENGFLHFETLGYAEESEHLKEYTSEDRRDTINQVKALHAQGLSQREIGNKVGISASSVNRIIKNQ